MWLYVQGSDKARSDCFHSYRLDPRRTDPGRLTRVWWQLPTQSVHRLTAQVSVTVLFMELHLRTTVCHLPYGITQCYLPPDTGEHTPT